MMAAISEELSQSQMRTANAAIFDLPLDFRSSVTVAQRASGSEMFVTQDPYFDVSLAAGVHHRHR